MHRQLSRPSAAIRKINGVVPFNKGGTGGTNSTAAAENMGLVSRNKFNVANGVARLNGSALLEPAYLPSSIVSTATIDGPIDVFINSVTNFTISNYDANTAYVVSVSSGSFVRTGATIAYTSTGAVGTITLTINGKACSINVKNTGPLQPSITSPLDDAKSIGDSVILNSTAYALSSGTSNHNMSDWEISTDYAFTQITKSSYSDGVNKLTWSVSGLSPSTTYYARMRHKDAVYGYSSWSNVVKFTTKADFLLTTEEAILYPSITDHEPQQGWITALDQTGKRCAIANRGTNGRVYVFVKNEKGWAVEKVLKASTGISAFNQTISVAFDADGTRLAIGVPNEEPSLPGQGAVKVYVRSGNIWTLEQVVVETTPANYTNIGKRVAFSSDGTRLFASSGYTGTASYQGAVYVFLRTGTTWAQEARLIASDPLANANLGGRIAVTPDGTRLVASCLDISVNTVAVKAVYVFLRTGTSWAQEQKVVSADGDSAANFGADVAISSDGSRLAVSNNKGTVDFGSQGVVYTFTRSGSVWSQEQRITHNVPTSNMYFGTNLVMDSTGSNLIISAATLLPSTTSNKPGVFVYSRSGNVWTFNYQIVCSLGSTPSTEQMGHGLSISGDGSTFCSGIMFNNSRETSLLGGAVIFT